MIISPDRGYIFVHIPKTGGTALALALEARAKRDDIMMGDTPKAKNRRRRLKGVQSRGRLWKHSTLSDIDGLIAPDVLAGLFAFTLVRNPWDRAVSYYHWLQAQTFQHPAVALAQDLDFDPFIMNPVIQRAFLISPAGSYMRRVDGQEQCNAYIRIEAFQEDAAPLVQYLGFKIDLPLTNTSDRERDYRTYYTDTTADVIARCCAEDIARFGYSFG